MNTVSVILAAWAWAQALIREALYVDPTSGSAGIPFQTLSACRGVPMMFGGASLGDVSLGSVMNDPDETIAIR